MISRKKPYRVVSLALLCGLLVACGGSSSDDPPPAPATRSYAMGFTDAPHANSADAVGDAYAVIAREADMAVIHMDDGVPWGEALDNAVNDKSYTDTYDKGYVAGLDYKIDRLPAGHVVYLAVTPLNFARDGLAAHRGANANEELEPPWSGYTLDDPNVIRAFTRHCLDMIALFSPDYFAYAIEANILWYEDRTQWARFVTLAQAVYPAIKAAHPNLPVFLSLQTSVFHLDPATQTKAIDDLLPYLDVIALSAYPYMGESNPDLLPADYFRTLADLAPGKPLAIAETAWPAEDITDVTNTNLVHVPADPDAQRRYIVRLLKEMDALSPEFVTLFFSRDFDNFWESDFQYYPQPDVQLIRSWRDTGLYDGDGNARPALTPWRNALARPRR